MKSIFSLFFISFFLITHSVFPQTTYSWNGGSGNWSVATNWSPNGIPTAMDNVVITASGTYTVTLDGDSTVNDLIIGGTSGVQTLSITGRALTINGTATINDSGDVYLNTSTITGSGTLTNSGTLSIYSGTLDIDFENYGTATFSHTSFINGSLTTHPNSTIHIYINTTTNTLTIANGFTNHGLIYFTNAAGYTSRGTIDVTNGTLVNAADGTIESTSIPLYSTYGNSILAELDNQGTVTISQGFILNEASATHVNSGIFEINTGGALYLTQSGTTPSFTSTGTFTADSATTISVNGGTFDCQIGTFTINSSLTATNNASLQFSDSLVNLGTLTLNSSTLTCTTALNNQSTVSMNTSAINGAGTFTNSGTLTAYSSTLDIDFDNYGTASFSYNSFINNTLTTHPNSTIHVYINTTTNILTIANGFTNHGLIYFTNAAGYTSRGTIDVTNGTLVNATDGTIQSTSIPLYSTYGNSLLAELNNQGTVTISQGFILNKASAAHINSGIFNIDSNGTLYLVQSGTNPSFTNTGTLSVDSAAAISVSGGAFDYLPGTFTFNGSFSASNTASVHFTDSFINSSDINLSQSSLTCDSAFTNLGNLTLSYSTMTCAAGLDNQGTLDLNNSTIDGNGILTSSGTLSIYSGTLDIDFENYGTTTFSHTSFINGSLTTHPNSTIHIYVNTTTNILTIANGFTNHGLIYFTNAAGYTSRGTIDVTNGTLVNAADGTIESTSIPLYSTYGNSILAELDNQGTVTISQGFILNEASATHVNSGIFEINTGGALYLTQSGTTPSFTSTGTFTADSATTISVNGGTFDCQIGTFTINSSLTATNNASLQFSDSLVNLGTLTLNSSTLTCTTALNNQSTVSMNTSAINGAGTFTNSGTLTAYSSTLDIDFDNYGTASFSYNSFINNTLTTHPNSTIHVYINTTTNILTIANGFTNHGLIYFTNAAGYTSRGTIDVTNGTLVNATDGTIESNDLILYSNYSNSILAPVENQGTLRFNNSMTINKANESHYNSGEIQLNNATLTFQGNQFENMMAGAIGGNGTLNISGLSFVNNGSFIPGEYPGILNVQDDLPSAATAYLNFDLGGPIIGEFYNSLAVAQTANFDGTVNINLVDGFVPNVGQEFVLATSLTHNGSFLVQNGLSINAWKEFDLVYDSTALKLITRAISGQTSPHAYDDFSTAEDGVEIFVDVTYNDSDPNGENLTLLSVGPADNGVTQVGLNNMVSYTPDSSFTGEDRFIYTIENTSGCRTSGLVTVTVNPVIPVTPQLSYPADSSSNVAVISQLGWFYNVLIDSYYVQLSDVPTFNGGNEILVSGIVDTFVTINLSPQSTYYWRVQSENAAGASAWSVTWNFTTGNYNSAPNITSNPDTLAWPDSLYEYQVTAIDPDGDTLTYHLLTSPAFLSIDTTTGLIQGTPTQSDVGDHPVSMEVDDGKGGTTNQMFNLHVQPPLGIDDPDNVIPKEFALNQNYPNPFNPTTTIEYDLPKASHVKIEIYNLLGKKVATILDDYKNAGSYKLLLDSKSLASGVYFYRIQAGTYTNSKKMILLR